MAIALKLQYIFPQIPIMTLKEVSDAGYLRVSQDPRSQLIPDVINTETERTTTALSL